MYIYIYKESFFTSISRSINASREGKETIFGSETIVALIIHPRSFHPRAISKWSFGVRGRERPCSSNSFAISFLRFFLS